MTLRSLVSGENSLLFSLYLLVVFFFFFWGFYQVVFSGFLKDYSPPLPSGCFES